MSNRSQRKASLPLRTWTLICVLTVMMTASATAGDAARPRDVTLLVTDSGRYVLSGKPVAFADLRARLQELKSSGKPVNLHVVGGPKVGYQAVQQALQIAQEEGLIKVAFVMAPSAAPDTSASRPSK